MNYFLTQFYEEFNSDCDALSFVCMFNVFETVAFLKSSCSQ